MDREVINVNCVYGEEHVAFLKKILIPSLSLGSEKRICFHIMNYAHGSQPLFCNEAIENIDIIEHFHDSTSNLGFAACHNLLAKDITSDYFIILNPDCIMQKGAIDTLIKTFLKAPEQIGIVEGRQWPFEHPKEYDPETLETPWASGAFALINTNQYNQIGGMDERYFLYLEDVDLSWRMWLSGTSVLYEPSAFVAHFSNGGFYRDDLVENEKYYSVRNFVLISRKFFGKKGENKAWKILALFADQEIVSEARKDLEENFQDFQYEIFEGVDKSPHIKILGVNQFHELMK